MITSTSNSTTASAVSAADYMKQTTGLNKDDFMKLFVAQMQNQDPLNPSDSSAMVAQLAQITQVEQSYNANTNLKSLLSALNGSASMSAVSFIGKTVTANSDQVSLTSGGQATLNYNLSNAAQKVQVTVKNASGATVRTMTLGSAASGSNSVTWDGKDNNKASLPAGIYSFSVVGTAADGSNSDGTAFTRAVVDGVKLSQGASVLSAGGIDLPLANVTGISAQ